MGLLYVIKNKINAKVYVGITKDTLDRRWTEHTSKARCGKQRYALYNAMRLYGVENFSIEVLAEYSNWEDLCSAEIAKIAELDSVKSGYNMTKGGEGQLGRVCSEQVKQKLSRLNRGKQLSSEHRAKISLANKGKAHTQAHKAKIGLANKGRKSPAVGEFQ